MIHWNGNQLCAIDTETTGLDPILHEVVQICILPLDSNIQPRKDVFPFYVTLRPEAPELADPKAMKINGLKMTDLMERGLDREKAKDLLDEWVDKLGLPITTHGNRKRIIPLGQNYAFDEMFIKRWLGIEHYSEIFDYQVRDTKVAALFLNDRAAMHAEQVPFNKTNLTWLAKKLDVEIDRAHDALQDCLATAKVYKIMLQRGLLG